MNEIVVTLKITKLSKFEDPDGFGVRLARAIENMFWVDSVECVKVEEVQDDKTGVWILAGTVSKLLAKKPYGRANEKEAYRSGVLAAKSVLSEVFHRQEEMEGCRND